MCLSVDGTKSKRGWKRLLSFPVHSLFLVGQIQSAVPAGGLQQQPTGHEGNSTHHDALFARRWGSALQFFHVGIAGFARRVLLICQSTSLVFWWYFSSGHCVQFWTCLLIKKKKKKTQSAHVARNANCMTLWAVIRAIGGLTLWTSACRGLETHRVGVWCDALPHRKWRYLRFTYQLFITLHLMMMKIAYCPFK